MSDWHELQHGVGILIIYMLLLLSIPTPTIASKLKQQARPPLNSPHNEVASFKQPAASSTVDIPRLYSAYRVLLMEGGSDDKINVGEIGKRTAVTEDEENESMKKSAVTGDPNIILKSFKGKVKEKKPTKLFSSSSSKNDGKEAYSKCVRIEKVKDVDDKEKEKEKPEIDNPEIKSMTILNMDVPPKTTKGRQKTLDAVRRPEGDLVEFDSAERRIAELNRVYKDFMNAWKRPTPGSRDFNLFGENNKYPSRPIHLTALNELMNVVENLQQSNPVDDIVKAINDEMNPEMGGLFSQYNNKLTVGNNLVPSAQGLEKKKRISGRSSKIFKRVAPIVDSDMKSGSLYEEYKKKLNDILEANKHSRKSFATEKARSQPVTDTKLNALTQCHCDEAKHMIMAVDSGGPKMSKELTPCHCEATRPSSWGDSVKITNSLIPCHCATMLAVADVINACVPDARAGKTAEYLKALETSAQMNKENKLNGGLKPYYLSNSKHRQMVWNEVPLIRPGSSRNTQARKPQVISLPYNEAKPAPATIKSPQQNVAHSSEPTARSEQPMAKSEHPVANSSLRKNSLHSEAPTKKKSQLQHILKVFQAKHRSMNVRKTSKRGLDKLLNSIDGVSTNLGFPEVLVNKFNQAPDASGKIIENMARQLNVSPVEMAQRITSSSGQSQGIGTFAAQANIARPMGANYQWQRQTLRLRRQ